MSGYRQILLAIDFNEGTERVIERALELSRHYNSRLTIMHVVEPIPVDAGSETIVPPSLYLQQDYVKQAYDKLAELARRWDATEVICDVALGHTKHEILHRAEQDQTDLIIVGSHGRHGLALLLGSTANAVLHGAPCDVLAVRI